MRSRVELLFVAAQPGSKGLQAEGKPLLEATIEAAHLRFRPILMTSLAFTLGVLPLAIAAGASAASQNAIGTGVLGGARQIEQDAAGDAPELASADQPQG